MPINNKKLSKITITDRASKMDFFQQTLLLGLIAQRQGVSTEYGCRIISEQRNIPILEVIQKLEEICATIGKGKQYFITEVKKRLSKGSNPASTESRRNHNFRKQSTSAVVDGSIDIRPENCEECDTPLKANSKAEIINQHEIKEFLPQESKSKSQDS